LSQHRYVLEKGSVCLSPWIHIMTQAGSASCLPLVVVYLGMFI